MVNTVKNHMISFLSTLKTSINSLFSIKINGFGNNPSYAFTWDKTSKKLKPIKRVSRIPLSLLKGIDRQTRILLQNTKNHAMGLPANNALLWGARGTGKSSLVKAIHAEVNYEISNAEKIILVEIFRDDLASLPYLLNVLRDSKKKGIIFCDDLSFESSDDQYKSIKTVLDGGLEGRPSNVLFYATSNRRHIATQKAQDINETQDIHFMDSLDERISLSDRFGLWLGFHPIDQQTFMLIIESYINYLGIKINKEKLMLDANEWSITRGSRSGRIAWQYVKHIAAEHGKTINLNND